MAPRCARKRMLQRVGPFGYSSTSRAGSRIGSDRRGCSKNYEACSPWTKKHWAWLIVVFMVLLVIGVTAVLSLRATVSPGASSVVDATGEGASFSSKSSISELPKTGGP